MPKFLLLIMICGVLIATDLSAAVIRLKADVQIEQTLVRLGDVAVVSEADDDTIRQLEQLTIGPAPAAGKSVRITLDTVRRELTLRGIDQSALEYAGSSAAVVTRLAPSVPETKSHLTGQQELEKRHRQLQQAISLHLQQVATEWGPVEITITEQELQRLYDVLAGVQNLQITGGQPPWTGGQTFNIQGDTAHGQRLSESIVCQLSYRPRLLALREGLARGQVIRPTDLVWVQPNNSSTGLTDPEKVIGTELVRSVRAEIPLQADDVRPLPLIRRNDVVAVTAQIGNITVKRYCRSLDEGVLGAYVTLIPVDGKEKITAQVAGLREAEIVFTGVTAETDISEQTPLQRPTDVTLNSRQQRLPLQPNQNLTPRSGSVAGPVSGKQPVMIVPVSTSENIPAGNSKIYANQPAQLPAAPRQ